MDTKDRSAKLVEDRARKKLKVMGYYYDDLPEKEKDYLLIIESCIQEIIDRENKARDLLTKNNVSIKNVSKQTNIARQTFYNNHILNEYVVYSNEKFKMMDISLSLSSYQEKIQMLEEQIQIMRKRDVEIEELKIDIEYLKKEMKLKDKTIIAFRNRIK